MCILAQVLQPMRLALLVFVYHNMEALVILQVCHVAAEEVKTAVWHPGKEILGTEIGNLSILWGNIWPEHVCVS